MKKTKKTWNTPQLTVQGSVEKLTQGDNGIPIGGSGFGNGDHNDNDSD